MSCRPQPSIVHAGDYWSRDRRRGSARLWTRLSAELSGSTKSYVRVLIHLLCISDVQEKIYINIEIVSDCFYANISEWLLERLWLLTVTLTLQLRSLRLTTSKEERLARSQLSKVMAHHLGCCARWLLFANSERIGGIHLTGPLSLPCLYLIKPVIFARVTKILNCELDLNVNAKKLVEIYSFRR